MKWQNAGTEKKQHAGFWEDHDRIREVGWVKSNLTVKQGVKAGFKAEWIVGNSWADTLADEAMHELINEQGEKSITSTSLKMPDPESARLWKPSKT